MEAELWYLLFLFAKKEGAKTLLINARISDKSYKSYKNSLFSIKEYLKILIKFCTKPT